MNIQKSVFRFRIRIQLGQWIRNPDWYPAGHRGPLKWKKWKKNHVKKKKTLSSAEGACGLLLAYIGPVLFRVNSLNVLLSKSAGSLDRLNLSLLDPDPHWH
jgi:hypothetical protein